MSQPPAPPLLLASTSPQRRAILTQLGLPFDVVAPRYEEHDPPDAEAVELVREHARGKAWSVAGEAQGRPVLGVFIYMLFRPPEYLDDVRERELEIRAMEERLAKRDLHCPVCRSEVDIGYLVCPICTTKLKQACVTCKAPLEALWQVCPFCETPVEPSIVGGFPTLESRRPRRRPE